MRRTILTIFILLLTINLVLALDCSKFTEHQCKASQILVKSLTSSVDSWGEEYYSNELITLDEDTSPEYLTRANERIENDFTYVINLLADYKENLQSEEKRGLFGDFHQIFQDYNEIINLIDSKISFFQDLKNKVPEQTNGVELRDLRASARGGWMEVLLIEKYAFLRLQPARAIVGTKCSVDEILEEEIPYLSKHFNLYPLWIEFKQRALNDQNIYDSLKSGFVQSWLNSEKDWEEVWVNPPQGFCEQPIQNQTNKTLSLSVAAIKIRYPDFSLGNLQEKINTLLNNHPDVDLIVTPEYVFFGAGFAGIDYRNDPITIECSNNLCSVKSIGTPKSNKIVTAVETLQNIASSNEVNIVFGTLAEREVVDGVNFTVDTQLIIDKKGNIVGKHRKYDVVYSNEVTCEANPSICEQVRNLNLETAIIYNLEDKEDNDFKILPHICGEKNEQKYIDRVAGSNAYLLVGSDFDQDFDYENITLTIQGGGNPFENPPQYSGNWLLKEIYLNKMMNNNAITPNGYFIVADGFMPSVGIISWNLDKIENLEITNDYIYGKINLEVVK